MQAVDHVSLTIRDDEVLGIAGESGCGKSTLIKVIYQFLELPLPAPVGERRADGRAAPAASRSSWRPRAPPGLVDADLLHPAGLDERLEPGGAGRGPSSWTPRGASAAFASRAELDARIAGYLAE